MGLASASSLVDELLRRVANLDRDVAVAALNRAQSWCTRQGSFQFMQSSAAQLVITAQAAPLQAATTSGAEAVDMDPGKAKMLFNTDGSPITHVPWSDFWQSVNYNLPVTTAYDTYTILSNNTAGQMLNVFYFLPNQTGLAVLYYHKRSFPMTDSLASFSVLPPDFDYLLVDIAEAEERRIYDIGDSWQLVFQQAQEQAKLLLDGYRSSTQQSTSLSDAQVKAQEVAQLGKN